MAHATSLTEANQKLEAAEARNQRAKLGTKTLEGVLVRKSMVVLTSTSFGAMRKFKVPTTIKGFPWKLGVWTLVTGVEALSKGMVQQAAGGISDTTMGIYLYDATATGSVIAGEGGEV